MESVLSDRGLRAPDITELVAPARALQVDGAAWQHMSDGLALFMRPGWHRAFRVPVDLPSLGTVGEHFIIGPLLRLVSGDRHFLVLALSQREVRLLEGSLQHVEELELRDVPTSLREVIEPAEPRSREGRVETLLLAAQPWCWEQVTADTPVVQLGVHGDFSHCELLDRAAADSLSRGGHIHALPTSEVPGGGDIAAVFRY